MALRTLKFSPVINVFTTFVCDYENLLVLIFVEQDYKFKDNDSNVNPDSCNWETVILNFEEITSVFKLRNIFFFLFGNASLEIKTFFENSNQM